MGMYEDKVVLCGASAYEQKYYFNKDFDKLPQAIQQELQIMCVLFTEDVVYLPENITVYDLFSADTIIPCHRYKSEVHMRCMLIIVDYGIDCIFLTKESFQILHGRLKIFFLSLR